jgi:hypothetical protein
MKPSSDINNELIPNAERAPRGCSFYNSKMVDGLLSKPESHTILWNEVIIATRCCVCQINSIKICCNQNIRILPIPRGFFHPCAALKAPVTGERQQGEKTARQWPLFVPYNYTNGVFEESIGLVSWIFWVGILPVLRPSRR